MPPHNQLEINSLGKRQRDGPPVLTPVSPGGPDTVSQSTPSAAAKYRITTTANDLQPLNPSSLVSSVVDTNEALSGWPGLKALNLVLRQRSDAYSPLKMVIGEFIRRAEILERTEDSSTKFKMLRKDCDQVFHQLAQQCNRDRPSIITGCVEALCWSIQNQLQELREEQGRNKFWSYFKIGKNYDKILTDYRGVRGNFQRLVLNMDTDVWKIELEAREPDTILDHLRPSLAARYDTDHTTASERRTCAPGTRIEVFQRVFDWVYNPETDSVYWLNGMAGTGKTTIIYSLCSRLNDEHLLAASFFCSRLLPECREVGRIMRTLAYQLSEFSYPFRSVLLRVLKNDPGVLAEQANVQFERLVVKPLVEVQETIPEHSVVVIDALDECDNPDSTSQILEALLKRTSHLPVKFIISSRPEPIILDHMDKLRGRRAKSRLVLHEIDKGTVEADVEIYLRQSLSPTSPSDTEIEKLVQQTGSLFIYAATIVRYIGYDRSPNETRERLETMLNQPNISLIEPGNAIDELYTTVLSLAIKSNSDETLKGDVKQVLGIVLCMQEPAPISILCSVLELDRERVSPALRSLSSVLRVIGPEELVAILHASFLDYMLDPARSKEHHFNWENHHRFISTRCFSWIEGAQPRFNICGLESSFICDREIPDINSRVDQTISRELYYGCRYWLNHLEFTTTPSFPMARKLEFFLSDEYLLWIEVMNLKGNISSCPGIMERAEQWARRNGCSKYLMDLIQDARRFVTEFALGGVRKSTPHVYVSMLAFWPPSSPLGRFYKTRTRALLPHGSAIEGRRADPEAITSRMMAHAPKWHTDAITSVDYSPNGSYIVSGSDDGTICIWGAYTGQIVGEPLRGHTRGVTSVKFSPNGSCIVSGSYDRTICVWDPRYGGAPMRKWQGGRIISAQYSRDGTYIAYGSYDRGVCNLKIENGQEAFQPDGGKKHGAVTSVSYDPNGDYIASGYVDGTVCIWHIQNWTPVAELHGHTNGVTSVAYSPNGVRLASGSHDFTVRIWDTGARRPALQPLRGHSQVVTSVDYSPDGSCIVSGSHDCTVCVWDAPTGQLIFGPLEGPGICDWITSVSFSPDNTHVVSGSRDQSIRIWSTQAERSERQVSFVRLSKAYIQTQTSHSGTVHDRDSCTMEFTIDDDGWISDRQSNLILWVPPGLRPVLARGNLVLRISSAGAIVLDWENALIGEQWSGCYESG